MFFYTGVTGYFPLYHKPWWTPARRRARPEGDARPPFTAAACGASAAQQMPSESTRHSFLAMNCSTSLTFRA